MDVCCCVLLSGGSLHARSLHVVLEDLGDWLADSLLRLLLLVVVVVLVVVVRFVLQSRLR